MAEELYPGYCCFSSCRPLSCSVWSPPWRIRFWLWSLSPISSENPSPIIPLRSRALSAWISRMNEHRKIQATYDGMAAQYDQIVNEANYAVPAWLQKNFPPAYSNEPFTAVDLGCGSGVLGALVRALNP